MPNQESAVIDDFKGDFRFLSNFYPSPIIWKNREWPSVEHAYQAAKSLLQFEQDEIRTCGPAWKAKKLGRKVMMRPDWEENKADVMKELVRRKFQQNDLLRQSLLITEDAILIEGNGWHDNFWGDCGCDKCEGIKGQNMLGKILMEIREELKEGNA